MYHQNKEGNPKNLHSYVKYLCVMCSDSICSDHIQHPSTFHYNVTKPLLQQSIFYRSGLQDQSEDLFLENDKNLMLSRVQSDPRHFLPVRYRLTEPFTLSGPHTNFNSDCGTLLAGLDNNGIGHRWQFL